MLDMIKKHMAARKKEVMILTLIQLATFVFGIIMFNIIMNVSDGSDTVFELATIITVVLTIFVSVLWGTTDLVNQFNTSVSMGRTRGNFIISYIVVSFIYMLAAGAVVYILHTVELLEFHIFYRGIPYDSEVGKYISVKNIALGIIICTCARTLFGAFLLKYGKKAWWVLWAVYMICCLGPSRMPYIMEASNDYPIAGIIRDMVNTIGGVTPQIISVILIIISLVMLTVSVLIMRKQRVTDW